MKCTLCHKEIGEFRTQMVNEVQKNKRLDIQKLRQQLNQQRVKYNEALQKNYGNKQTLASNRPDLKSKDMSSNEVFAKQLSKIAQKQNKLNQIRRLKLKINEKRTLLEQYNSQRNQNQKSKLIQQALQHIKTVKTQALESSQQKLLQVRQLIKEKSEKLNKLSKTLKLYFEETVGRDFSTILTIHKTFRIRESQKLFQIKKVDELDFFKSEFMTQSFYQIDNMEQIQTQTKTSEKGLHVLFQNILILKILQNICEISLPYQIDCKMDFIQSCLRTKIQNVKVSGKRMIDFGKTVKLSKNVMQIFSQQSMRESIRNQKTNQNEDQPFQQLKREFDQSIEYNMRRYALNNQFINMLQVDMEFLSIKYGVKRRPLVFFENQLMNAIGQQFMWRFSHQETGKSIQCPIQVYLPGYNSMLKQLTVIKLMENLENINTQETKREVVFSNRMIPEVSQTSEQPQNQTQTEIQSQESMKQGDSIVESYFNVFANYFSQKPVQQEQIPLPQSLENVVSNSTQNDAFEVLEPDSI